jgi:UDP-N-acetylglucosamine--N-acetylmuramyl-(pentapeptide) pyrophosphoryl-undecaprenol N-acetylglucosamine transferase
MSYAIAAAGTGGHVYPGLAVAEELVRRSVPKEEIVFIGGDRLEARVYPEHGFPFVRVELQSLKRSLSMDNLRLPLVLRAAVKQVRHELETRSVKVALGMGSYVTVPVAWAARQDSIPFYLHEQNGEAGLANKVMSRWAVSTFIALDGTRGVRRPELVGNPIRGVFTNYRRSDLRHEALVRYGIEPGSVVIGVFGGSLGAGVLNSAIARLARTWTGPDIVLLHLVGERNVGSIDTADSRVPWIVVGYEESMEYFYAASDLVIARAGGVAIAELTATHTPSILVPGTFGGGHQAANGAAMERAGAAVALPESRIAELEETVVELVDDVEARRAMAHSAGSIALTDAASRIATRLIDTHG